MILSALLFAASVSQALELTNPDTALEEYVKYQDGAYQSQLLATIPGKGFTALVYRIVSQKWLDDTEVDRSLWEHNLVTIVPDNVQTATSLLYVAGSNNTDQVPDASHPVIQIISQLAMGSQSITSAIFQVPNQPLHFADNSEPLKEDGLIAYSWNKAMNTGNYVYSAYLPMTKSVVKAMDAIQDFIPRQTGYQVNDFVLTGFSKRGAAVWLTAAIDNRVKAIAPGVIDFLNIIPSFEHHFKSYGQYSTAIQDYVGLGITDKLRSPEFKSLARVIDPLSYREKLNMPKLLLNSSGDQFFLPDSSRFYLDKLLGENLIRFAPNTDHSLNNAQTGVADSLYSLLGWYQSLLYGGQRPDIKWHVDEDGKLVAEANIKPSAVKLWRAYNPEGRDFRLESIGPAWTSSELIANDDGQYIANLPIDPNGGYHATFIEFVYTGLTGQPVSYSTQVMVTPDVMPFSMNDPINLPLRAFEWKKEIKDVLTLPMDDEARLLMDGYMPVVLFDKIIESLPDAYAILKPKPLSVRSIAERECISTRLNIKSKRLGWYSPLDDNEETQFFLWEAYELADQFHDFMPMISAIICHHLNQVQGYQ